MCFLNKKIKKGWIEVITGCMFSGKTEEFIYRLINLKYFKFKIQVFKPTIDNRYSHNFVVSHNKKTFKAISINNSFELLINLKLTTNVVGIDEVQFFDKNIIKVIDFLIYKGIIVIANGLDKDFRGKSFINIEQLIIRAKKIKKLYAICVKCGNFADRTQRLINGKLANYFDKLILIGKNDKYEARCFNCYKINILI